MNLLQEIAALLECHPRAVQLKLNHPADRHKVLKAFNLRQMRTSYADRSGQRRLITMRALSTQGAHLLPVYGALKYPFGINVAAYFHCRHRIRLSYPYMPCVIDFEPSPTVGQMPHYYPLELLEVIRNEEEEKDAENPDFANIDDDGWSVNSNTITPSSENNTNKNDDIEQCSPYIWPRPFEPPSPSPTLSMFTIDDAEEEEENGSQTEHEEELAEEGEEEDDAKKSKVPVQVMEKENAKKKKMQIIIRNKKNGEYECRQIYIDP